MAVVRDYMNRDYVVLRDNMNLKEATEALLSKSVSGAPVVDSSDNLAGFITERDIISRIREGSTTAAMPLHLSLFDAIFLYDSTKDKEGMFEREIEKSARILVKDVMWKKVITVSPEDNIEIALYYLSKYRINRLPVVESGKIVGIVSRKDVLDSIFRIMQKEEPEAPQDHP